MADPIQLEPNTPRAESVTEDRVARVFTQEYGRQFLYCHDHGAWFMFDGSVWKQQRTPMAFHMMRELVERMSLGARNKIGMQKKAYCLAAEGFARADPVLSMTAEDWDTDIFLMGTPDGTVDLHTGKVRASDVADRITKSAAVVPEDFEDCPNWHKFLREATGDDDEMILFLKQICGYALTGDISEQMLFFIFGPGGNGKGTFLSTLQAIMGDYSVVAPMEALENQRFAQHTTDLAMMRGARLVSASETEEGRGWNENRIKALTGGDRITARFMHKDNITFTPQLTLVVIGNHKPLLRTVDKAIQRRFNMIPFTVQPKTIDKHLDEKLKAEWPGILRWMINGCLDWQNHGFTKPSRVLMETQKYFEEQDIIGEWLKECCTVEMGNDHLMESSSILFASWSKFAIANGISPGNTKTFKPALLARGFEDKRLGVGMFFKCIELKRQSQYGDDDAFV